MGFSIERVAADGTCENILYLSYSLFADLIRVLEHNEVGVDVSLHPGRALLRARRVNCEDGGRWSVHATRVVRDYLTHVLDARQRIVTEGTMDNDTAVTRMRFIYPPLDTRYHVPPDWDDMAEELEQGLCQAVALGQMVDFV